MWPCADIAGQLSLRIQQLDVYCETKTKDNVFVQVAVAVQYRVLAEKAYDAYYRLSDPREQIRSYVFDVVRSTVPRMDLDDAFASKKDIADSVLQQLTAVMSDYGYEIMESLVTDLSPDAKVKASMNEINASKRLRAAASYKAEADKVKQVKAAEAEAEAKYLSGLGIARQRKAIVEGLQSSVEEFSNEVDDVKPKDVMDILLLSQYFDTLSNVGANSLILEHDPSVVHKLQAQVASSFGKK
jgi:regulator of protease activity HflC (stomatin/prohibitin superfamily)